MNEILEDLLNVCNEKDVTVMRFFIYDCGVESPTAIIEDKDGRVSTVYYNNGVWI